MKFFKLTILTLLLGLLQVVTCHTHLKYAKLNHLVA